MSIQYSPSSANSPLSVIFESCERRTAASYELELTRHRPTEIGQREALAQEEALLSQRAKLLEHRSILSQESDHRLSNGVQMIVSLLALQSRTAANAELACQLAAAADRVATVGRIHQRLHSLDGVRTFAIKQYLCDLCRDFSVMPSPMRPVVLRGLKSIRRPSPPFRSTSSRTN